MQSAIYDKDRVNTAATEELAEIMAERDRYQKVVGAQDNQIKQLKYVGGKYTPPLFNGGCATAAPPKMSQYSLSPGKSSGVHALHKATVVVNTIHAKKYSLYSETSVVETISQGKRCPEYMDIVDGLLNSQELGYPKRLKPSQEWTYE